MHLVDAHLASDPAKYMAALLASLAAMLHLELPHVNVLSKVWTAPPVIAYLHPDPKPTVIRSLTPPPKLTLTQSLTLTLIQPLSVAPY